MNAQIFNENYDNIHFDRNHDVEERMDEYEKNLGYQMSKPDYQRMYDVQARNWDRENRISDELRFKRQGKIPVMRSDGAIKRVIAESKKTTYKPSEKELKEFVRGARNNQMKMVPQGWSPAKLQRSVFKIFNQKDQFCCTGTLVGGRMFVVNHVIDETLTGKYRAVNLEHVIDLALERFCTINSEIGYFPVGGIPSEFSNKSFQVLDRADIVTVYGYGSSTSNGPEALNGFASVAGWCNAKTKGGDCSAPVLTSEGKIVGFWTHGDEKKGFGRFEPITQEFIDEMKLDPFNPTTHIGLDFRLGPSSQKL
jgi:hypothetical protein